MQPATTADRMSVSCRVTKAASAEHGPSGKRTCARAARLRLFAADGSDQRVHHRELGAHRAQLGRDVGEQRALRSKRGHRLAHATQGSAADVAPARRHTPHRLRLSDDVVQLCCGAMDVAALTQQLARAPALYLHPASRRRERVRVTAAHDGSQEPHAPNKLRAVAGAAACCAGCRRQRHGTHASGASRRYAPSSAACSRLATRLLRTRRNSCGAASMVSTRGAAPRRGSAAPA